MEVSVIYLYSMQGNVLEGVQKDDWEQQWSVFERRALGLHVGPMLGRAPEQFEGDLVQDDMEAIAAAEDQAASQPQVDVAAEEAAPVAAEGEMEEAAAIAESEAANVGGPSTDADAPMADESMELGPVAVTEEEEEEGVNAAAAYESTPSAVDDAGKGDNPDAKQAELAPAVVEEVAVPVQGAAASVVTGGARALTVEKPDHPTVLICPMVRADPLSHSLFLSLLSLSPSLAS
jgi:hypothetical protein